MRFLLDFAIIIVFSWIFPLQIRILRIHLHPTNLAFLISKPPNLLPPLHHFIFLADIRPTLGERWTFAILIMVADLIEVVNFPPDCVFMRPLDYSSIQRHGYDRILPYLEIAIYLDYYLTSISISLYYKSQRQDGLAKSQRKLYIFFQRADLWQFPAFCSILYVNEQCSFPSIQSQIFSIMETPKRHSKQTKFPILRQLSEQRLPSLGKIDSLNRDNSSHNISNQSFKTLFKPKNVEESGKVGKTLLKNAAYFNRPSLATKIDIKEAADCHKNVKLLKKANEFGHFSKENVFNPHQHNLLQKPSQLADPKQSPSSPPSIPLTDQQLRESLSNFHQTNLAQGVRLKIIDLQQD